MKKWAILGVVAAVIVGVLLIGKYQDQKYPVEADGSNLLEEVTWWVNRGYDQPVLDDIRIYAGLGIGDRWYKLMEVDDQLGMVYLELGPNGNYRIAGTSYGGGNFYIEELENNGIPFVLLGGKNEYFGIKEIAFDVDNKTYRVAIPPGGRFLTKIEIDPPRDPDAPPRHIDVDTIRFYDADGQDITDQIPWNGMQPWDGASSVSPK